MREAFLFVVTFLGVTGMVAIGRADETFLPPGLFTTATMSTDECPACTVTGVSPAGHTAGSGHPAKRVRKAVGHSASKVIRWLCRRCR
jgi:hypothetical protein